MLNLISLIGKFIFTTIMGVSVMFTNITSNVEANSNVSYPLNEETQSIELIIDSEEEDENIQCTFTSDDEIVEIDEIYPEAFREEEAYELEIYPEAFRSEEENNVELYPEGFEENQSEDNFLSNSLGEADKLHNVGGLIENYNKQELTFCKDFEDNHNGACGPVSVLNTAKILEATQGVDIIGEDEQAYNEVVDFCDTTEDGGTAICNLLDGTNDYYDTKGVDFDLEYIEDTDVFESIKEEIDNDRPIILCDTTPGIEHGYTVIGYQEEDGVKSLITFTGWVEEPYRIVPLSEDNTQIFIRFVQD